MRFARWLRRPARKMPRFWRGSRRSRLRRNNFRRATAPALSGRALSRQGMGNDRVGVAVAHPVFGFQMRDKLHMPRRHLALDDPEPMADRLAVFLFDGWKVRRWSLDLFRRHLPPPSTEAAKLPLREQNRSRPRIARRRKRRWRFGKARHKRHSGRRD